MKRMIFIVLLCAFTISNAQNKAQKIYKDNLLIIERYLSGQTIYGDSLDRATTFLERLTNIKSNIDQQYDEIISPNEENFKDWNTWFDKNKGALYWDKTKNKVSKRGKEVNVIKKLSPKEVFLKNLSVFEEINKGGSANLNSIYESREFLIQITGITYDLENEFDMPNLPSEETVNRWKSWYEINKDNLYWNNSKKKVMVNSKK